ncbi:hypothetical protein JWH06_08765 [Xanthomonas melonis]|nr:P-loop NTPase fold protein [Xanthomonas melonis]MCD0245614.1 hypothetical protein [Xanthomonas melonis]MCD0258276.1 hypothetical protein [Xanthomonas melonis]
MAPVTFGVHGDWGAGKTSFLKQLRYALDQSSDADDEFPSPTLKALSAKSKVVTVWFEAWRYQHEPAPVIALIQEIRRSVTAAAKAKKKVKKLSEVAFRTVLYSLDDAAKLLRLEAMPLGPGRIQEIGENYEKENLQQRLGSDGIQAHLEQAIAMVLDGLGAKDGRLVVFIDDLDRCSPESAFRLLEGLKIYLTVSRCVFVIGMNHQLVVDSISSCIPSASFPEDVPSKSAYAKMRAEAYLEKICTSIERLVPVSDPLRIVREWTSSNELREDLMRYQVAPESVQNFLPPNPRRIKAFVNELQRNYHALRDSRENPFVLGEIAALIIISYIYQFHSELFQRWQFNPGFLTYLRRWILSSDPKSPVEWPSYLTCLELPIRYKKSEQTEPLVRYERESMYPDPYAPNIFWIAPLVADGGVTERIATEIFEKLYGTGV